MGVVLPVKTRCTEAMARDYASGRSGDAVAHDWGVTRQTVVSCARRYRTVLGERVGRCTDEWMGMYQSGMSLDAIGGQAGVCHETVRRCLVGRGVVMRPVSRPAMSEAMQRSICEMFDAGEMVSVIAARHGVHRRTVTRALERDLAELEARG